MVHKTLRVCDFGAWSALKTSSPNNLPITQFMPATLPPYWFSSTVSIRLPLGLCTVGNTVPLVTPLFAQMLSLSSIFSNHTSKIAHSCHFLPLLYLLYFFHIPCHYLILYNYFVCLFSLLHSIIGSKWAGYIFA